MSSQDRLEDGTQLLPYCKISPQVKRTYEEIMRNGNVPLHKWYKKSEKYRPCKKYGRLRFRKDIFKEANGWIRRVKLFGVTIPKTDIKKMFDVQNIESDVLAAFARMARQVSVKWSLRILDRAASVGDLYHEAYMALARSIYYYTRPDVQFSTYAYWAIKRRMIAVCNRPSPLSEMPQATIELRQRYDETKAAMNRRCTFPEVVMEMGLSKPQIETLRASLVLVFSQDTLSPYHEDRDVSDFSTAGSSVFNGLGGDREWRVVARRGRSPLHPVFAPVDDLPIADLATYLAKAEFTELEQDVLEGFFADSSNGWQTRLARTLINPETEKPYTRMSVSLAWHRIIQKLQEVIQ